MQHHGKLHNLKRSEKVVFFILSIILLVNTVNREFLRPQTYDVVRIYERNELHN